VRPLGCDFPESLPVLRSNSRLSNVKQRRASDNTSCEIPLVPSRPISTSKERLISTNLWDRYSQETEALGFNGVYERFLALQAGFPDDPKTYRAAEAERAWPAKVVREASALEE
jgi:hypothetical protein